MESGGSCRTFSRSRLSRRPATSPSVTPGEHCRPPESFSLKRTAPLSERLGFTNRSGDGSEYCRAVAGSGGGSDQKATEGTRHVQNASAFTLELRGNLHPRRSGRAGRPGILLDTEVRASPRPQPHSRSEHQVKGQHRAEGAETPLSATLSQDLAKRGLRPANRGVCSCEPPTTFTDCTCEWGRLVRAMLHVGYSQPTVLAAQELLELSSVAQEVILGYRQSVYRRLAAAFRGSADEFRALHGFSRTVFYRLGLRVPRS